MRNPVKSKRSSQRGAPQGSGLDRWSPPAALGEVSPVAQRLVAVLAMVGVPVTRSGLMKALRSYPAAMRASGKEAERAFEEIERRSLVEVEAQRWMAPRPLAVFLPWVLRRGADWEHHLHAACVLAGQWQRSAYGETSALRAIVFARAAFFDGGVDVLEDLLEDVSTFAVSPQRFDQFLSMLAEGLPEATGAEPVVVTVVLQLFVTALDLEGSSPPARQLVDWLDRAIPKASAAGRPPSPLRESLDEMAAECALVRGDWQACRQYCGLGEGQVSLLGVAVDWLCGESTLERFLERHAQRVLRSATGTPNEAGRGKSKARSKPPAPRWEGLGSALLVVAMLSRQTTELDVEARAIARACSRKDASPVGREVAAAALSLVQVRQGRVKADRCPSGANGPTALAILLEQVLMQWMPTGSSSPQGPRFEFVTDAERLVDIIAQDSADSPWLVRQILGLLRRVSPDYAAHLEQITAIPLPAPVPGELQLVELLEEKAEWQQLFEQIEGCVEPATIQASSEVGTKRLAWTVELYGEQWDIQPKLQTLQSKGFSSGRNVALKRLAEGDFPCELAPADVAVVARIRRNQQANYYRGYPEVSYSVDPNALPLLVGHPAVFDGKSMAPLRVVVGQPRVVLEPAPEGYRFRRLPDSSAPVVVERAGSDLTVYELSPEQRRLFEVLERSPSFPSSALPRAREALRSASSSVLCVDGDEFLGDVREQPADGRVIVQLRPGKDRLDALLVVRPFGEDGETLTPGCGPELVVAQQGAERVVARRDREAEQRAVSELLELCPLLQPDPVEGAEVLAVSLQDTEAMLELASTLSRLDVLAEWPEGNPYKVLSASRARVSVRANDSMDWLDVDVDVEVDEATRVDYALLVASVRAGRRFVPLDNGAFVELQGALVRRIEQLSAYEIDPDKPSRLHPLAAVGLEGQEDWAVEGDEGWTEKAAALESLLGAPVRMPRGLTATLRDYQRDGVQWAIRLARLGTGACLADDMGLGKTVQTLAVLLARASQGPALVIAPASVLGNWQREAARFAPALQVVRLAEMPSDPQGGGGRSLPALGKKSVLLATYDLAAREVEALCAVHWATLVLDEAQAIKNPSAQRTRAIARLPASFRLALSGTPLENHLGELWSLFHVVNPGLLGTRASFVERFQGPIEREADPVRLRQLQHLISPFVLRRTKQQVLGELPPRTDLVLEVELSADERKLYEASRLDALTRLSEGGQAGGAPGQDTVRVLAELTRLRQLCCHPRLAFPKAPRLPTSSSKHDALLELLDELRRGGHRALVFSQFVKHLALVRKRLDALKISYQYLDGSTRQSERDARVAAFQAGEGEVFLISLKAGGVGLNLTGADFVIHLDPWWNPAVEDQASDRAHRIGQTRPVTVYRLIAKDTIEDKLVALHEKKRGLADQILSAAGTAGRLSAKQLVALLKRA